MRTSARLAIALLGAAFALGGCGNVPGVPDHTYFRMSTPQALPRSDKPLFVNPIVVGLFEANGLYADRALVYALDPQADELRQYHYQLWTDPPTRLLQRRLQIELRESGIAPLVIDALAASIGAVRISGEILRFERVPTVEGGHMASVVLKLRANRPDGSPQLEEIYHADVPAADNRLLSTANALFAAVDQIFAEFHADLIKSEALEHAR
jgi:cholesterol transport system auxiliary component